MKKSRFILNLYHLSAVPPGIFLNHKGRLLLEELTPHPYQQRVWGSCDGFYWGGVGHFSTSSLKKGASHMWTAGG